MSTNEQPARESRLKYLVLVVLCAMALLIVVPQVFMFIMQTNDPHVSMVKVPSVITIAFMVTLLYRFFVLD